MSALPIPILPELKRTRTAPRETTPDYLPARMVNEFVYCPRLFFYEWVEGVFRESADTLEGSAQHKRVDARPSELPPAAQPAQENKAESKEEEKIHARSVTLSSERLRVIAKLDLVEAVPLPANTALPRQFRARARVWESVTPFVRPHNRHFRRSNGKLRPEEEAENICGKLIEKVWGVRPARVEKFSADAPWVKLHETAAMRRDRRAGDNRTPHVGPGHYLRVTFAEDFQGPLIVGDSAHYGLGEFQAVTSAVPPFSTIPVPSRFGSDAPA